MRNFKELKIWQKGFQIAVNCFKYTATFPKEEKYGIVSQINRAGVSIPSNIAEGASRNSEVEFKRFLEIAIGSSFELETQLLIIENLKMINSDVLKDIFILISSEQKMINSLISKINSSKNTKH